MNNYTSIKNISITIISGCSYPVGFSPFLYCQVPEFYRTVFWIIEQTMAFGVCWICILYYL